VQRRPPALRGKDHRCICCFNTIFIDLATDNAPTSGVGWPLMAAVCRPVQRWILSTITVGERTSCQLPPTSIHSTSSPLVASRAGRPNVIVVASDSPICSPAGFPPAALCNPSLQANLPKYEPAEPARACQSTGGIHCHRLAGRGEMKPPPGPQSQSTTTISDRLCQGLPVIALRRGSGHRLAETCADTEGSSSILAVNWATRP
jgi:hypothetical protein